MTDHFLHTDLERSAREWGEKSALLTPVGQISYTELNRQVQALAAAFAELGFTAGERIAILGHNSADYIVWHYATARAGLILHVLNTRLVHDELAWMINNADSSALVADSAHVAIARTLQNDCPSLRCLIGMSGEGTLEHNTSDLIANAGPTDCVRPKADTAALMIYTSGTTGRPKGALQTHSGSCAADRLTRDAVEITESDVYLALMPFFHQAGLIRTRATLLAGGCCVIPGRTTIEQTGELIIEHGVTFTMLASAQHYSAIMQKALAEGPQAFRGLRMLLGAGGMGERSVATIKKVREALDCQFFGVYGQTETTGTVVSVCGDDVYARPDSCGKALPGIDIAIWASNARVLPTGEVGEIMVRGPVTTCYWRNDEANKTLYTGRWLHTGDLGFLDEDGFLYLKGRSKELIKTGAENVYPREVETVLELHPQVRDVAVIGVPDPDWGEVVCVAIVPTGESTPTLEDIRDYCRGKIAGYKLPRTMMIVADIPRNHTGKILRRDLVRQHLPGAVL